MAQSTRDQVFISYSHKDKRWLGKLQTTLKPLVRNRTISVWDDTKIRAGAKWKEEIKAALAAAKAAVLLVSPHFLASDFIVEHELPALLRAAEHEGLTVLWIHVSSSLYDATEINDYQALHDIARPLDSLSRAEQGRVLTEVCRQIASAAERTPIPVLHSPSMPCPYPGLEPYDERFSNYFFGRDREVLDIAKILEDNANVVLSGMSGAGKSSLIAGGLIPRLKNPGYQNASRLVAYRWTTVSVHPQQYPASDLEFEIPGITRDAPAAVRDRLQRDAADRLLIIIDPLEQCFRKTEQHQQFAKILCQLARVDQCSILSALHAAFLPDLRAAPWPTNRDAIIDVNPLEGDRLADAISLPAKKVGVDLEQSLVVLLTADAADEPSRLPLLQSTMVHLWRHEMNEQSLLLAAYAKLATDSRGRLAYALTKNANGAIRELSPDQREIAQRIFLRLVQFVPGRPDTRRVQPLSALKNTGESASSIREVVQHLADKQLLTMRPPVTDDVEVTLLSDALITDWPMMQELLGREREGERVRRRFEEKAQEWIRLERCGGLLDEGALDELDRWLAEDGARNHSSDLEALRDASRSYVEEVRLTREGEQRLRRVARAVSLAADSKAALTQDPQRALVLAIEAVEASRSYGEIPVPQAEEALRMVMITPVIRRIQDGHVGTVIGITCDTNMSDGWVLIIESGGRITRYSIADETRTTIELRPPEALRCASFDRSGRMVTTCDNDGPAVVWDLATAAVIATLKRRKESIRGVAFRPDGDCVITAEEDGTVREWSARTGDEIRALKGHQGAVNTAVYNSTGTAIASAGEDATVRIWATDKQPLVLRGHVNGVNCLAWSHKGDLLISGGEDRTVRVWQVSNQGRFLAAFEQHESAVRTVALTADGNLSITACGSETLRVWDMAELRRRSSIVRPGTKMEVVACGLTGRNAVAWDGSSVLILDPERSERLPILRCYGYGIADVCYSPDGKQIAVSTRGGMSGLRGDTTVWNSGTGQLLYTIFANPYGILRSAFDPTGSLLMTVDVQGQGVLWSTLDASRVGAIVVGHQLRAAEFSPDGMRVIVIGSQFSPVLWDITEGKLVKSIPDPGGQTNAVAWARRSNTILVGCADGRILAYDGATLTLIKALTRRDASVESVAAAEDGSVVASAYQDGSIVIWDGLSGTIRCSIQTGSKGVPKLEISPDGNTCSSIAGDGRLQFWHTRTGQLRCNLPLNSGSAATARFSADGRLFAVGTNDSGLVNTVRQYTVDLDSVLKVAQSLRAAGEF
ncbi:MAG: TIR domain-containing protein [Verrucomicrobia bacterium]|nr:TIR domain-containing protein [Verrucomicrobiota bacterium]